MKRILVRMAHPTTMERRVRHVHQSNNPQHSSRVCRAHQSTQSGYIMLPVMLTVVLVATIAFMMNHEGSMGARTVSNALQAEQARYVAEAGLQHALWQSEQQGCGPYTNLTNQVLGGDSYTTNLTSGLGSTTSFPIAVDQDSWIESDRPDANHATDANLKIQFKGGTIERPVYRYDLSSLPADAAILSATAWFYVNKEHPEGSVDIHLLTTDWNEANATWQTLGDSMDSAVLATIPTQPDKDVWVSANLTASVQAWVNGQPNYGIALNSVIETVDGEYASREDSQQPYLTVIVGIAPSSPATLTSVGTLASGVTRTIQRNEVVLRQQPSHDIHWQHDATLGVDAEIWDQQPNTNYGNAGVTWVSSASNDKTRSLLRFNMGAIPAGARILQATLSLYRKSGSGADQPVSAHRITNPWSEDSVTWNSRLYGTNWDTAGVDFDQMAVATTPVGPTNQRYEWNITPLVQGWVDGNYPNYGVVLTAAIAGMPGEEFYTSDDADPARRPNLSITYACECGQACVAPQGTGNILMVVSNEWNLTDGELTKKALFESWGYAVDLISQWDVSWNFDNKADSNDVVYVSEAVESTTWGMAPKLAATTLGVVHEEGGINDELGIASSFAWLVGQTINITDTSHYITQPFVTGELQIFSAGMEGLSVSGTLAGGLQSLADLGSAGGLVLLESGADLYGGGSAPGRRVMLPLGRDAIFNWDYLNNNGRLIVQRAIEWAMNKAAPVSVGSSLWLSTMDDVSSSGAPGLDAWTDGEVIAFADPDLALEPGTTDGTFSSVVNLDDFGNGADIDALHYVGSDITVGSNNSVDLLAGDLLISTADGETLTSLNSLSVNDEDVFVFRPATAGDYSSGIFIFLIDGSQIHSEADTVGISLVEKDTLVGDRTPLKGKFLIAISNRRDVIYFAADDVGLNTTSGAMNEMIDGPSLHFGSEIRGLDLAEEEITLGGHTIPAGSILLTLNNDGSSAGDNYLWVNSEDLFYLTVTQIGASPVADATLLLDGSDVNLNTAEEQLQALTLTSAVSAEAAKIPIAHWKLDETSGTTAVDSVGGNHGTLINAPVPVWVAGKLDGGLSFDGDNDYIDLSSMNPMSYDDFTVSAWYKSADSSVSDDEYIFEHNENWVDEVTFGPTDDGTGDRLRFGFARGGSGTWDPHYGTSDIVDQQWHHVVGVRSSGRIKLYVDGVEETDEVDAHAGLTIKIDGDGPFIGDLPGNTEQVHGVLDDVRLYDRALTAAEISDLFTAGGGGGSPPACSATFGDDFETDDYAGSTGTAAWASDWSEINDSGNPSNGDVQVASASGNLVLLIGNSAEGAQRVVDLSTYSSATLRLGYWRSGLDSADEFGSVEVSADGSSWTVLDQYVGPGNDATSTPPTVASYDISGHISSTTHIRFITAAANSKFDRVLFDDIEICANN